MPITLTPGQSAQTPGSTGPGQVTPFNPQAASAMLGGNAFTGVMNGLNGSSGTAGSGNNNMQALVQALQKAKLNATLNGRLPGTTPQSVGAGTAMSDQARAPAPPQQLSLGGTPGPQNA